MDFDIGGAFLKALQHAFVDERFFLVGKIGERIERIDFLPRVAGDRLQIFVPPEDLPARVVEIENPRHRVDQRVAEFLFAPGPFPPAPPHAPESKEAEQDAREHGGHEQRAGRSVAGLRQSKHGVHTTQV